MIMYFERGWWAKKTHGHVVNLSMTIIHPTPLNTYPYMY